jgi:hypothetical protein
MKLGQDEKRKDFMCWSKDARAQSLRVELVDGSFYIFPYSRLQCAHFEPGANGDRLHLLLDTHEVRITGRNVCELGLAFQKLAVEFVRQFPPRYPEVTDRNTVFIAGITVTESEAPQCDGSQDC